MNKPATKYPCANCGKMVARSPSRMKRIKRVSCSKECSAILWTNHCAPEGFVSQIKFAKLSGMTRSQVYELQKNAGIEFPMDTDKATKLAEKIKRFRTAQKRCPVCKKYFLGGRADKIFCSKECIKKSPEAMRKAKEYRKKTYWADPISARNKVAEQRAKNPEKTKKIREKSRLKNKEKAKISTAKWRQKNKEKMAEYDKKRWESASNREKRRKQAQERYQKNKEKINLKRRGYKEKDKEKKCPACNNIFKPKKYGQVCCSSKCSGNLYLREHRKEACERSKKWRETQKKKIASKTET